MSAYNAVGEGSVSPTLVVKAAAAPNSPPTCTKVAQSAGSITIAWTTPYNGGTAITGYKIFWDGGSGSADTSTYLEKVANTGLVNQLIINTDLVIDNVYQFSVKAVNVVGTGDFSPVV